MLEQINFGNLYHYIDALPFLIATLIVILGAVRLRVGGTIVGVVIITTAIYMVAQSAWFSAFLAGNTWGRDFSNYIWFLFNTLTMGIFTWVLVNSKR